ncbi:MAG: hypothetical protein WCJ35_21780 [Planctomycetota bacterium]
MDSGKNIYPGTVAWLRQLTLREIIAKPWLLIYQPRLFLENPWLLVVLFGVTGLLTGIISGAQQGACKGIGKMAEGALLCGFVGGVIGAIVLTPVALGLWVIREVGTRCNARRSTSATNDSHLAIPSTGCEPQQFPYRPNRLFAVSLFLMCLGGELELSYFGFQEHDIFLSIMAIAIGPLGLIAIGSLVVSAFTQQRRVAFTEDQLILPKPHWSGLSTQEIQIAFREIAQLRFAPMGLFLTHRNGKYFLARVMFPSRNDFDAVTALIVDSMVKSQHREAPATDAESLSRMDFQVRPDR